MNVAITALRNLLLIVTVIAFIFCFCPLLAYCDGIQCAYSSYVASFI